MKFFKLLSVFIVIFIFPGLGAGDSDFMNWLKNYKTEYKNFQEERDKEFHSFLKGKWKNFDVEKGKKEDKAPKPDKPPVAEKVKVDSKAISVDKIKTIEEKKEPVKIVKPLKANIKKDILIGFFGEVLKFPEIKGFSVNHSSADKDSVAKFWENFSSKNLSPVLKQFNYYKYKKNFNDWGLFLMEKAYAKKISNDENTRTLILWGLMLKSGYDVRIGFAGSKIKLLFTSESDIFANPFFELDGKRYYLFNDKTSSIKSYDASYKGADKKLRAFFFKRPDIITRSPVEKDIKFTYKDKKYEFKTYYNPGLIAFMNSVPQLSLDKYFIGTPDSFISKKLTDEIKEKSSNFSDKEKIDFILRMVQKGFPYKTDDEQFAKEKYFYPEELLYYPYSDCEDRSALFASLVRSVTGFDVVILDYPGHVATAVHLPEKIKGDYVTFAGKKYYVADPTYINANIGMVMPGYGNKKPEIISIK
ncbi:MAG: hypothetical protein CSA18_00300 [Deltaproteobacteria bacterium]|nr:MAG: hypothetical protein CSA18_00300 [Deltaproteobacteria bacterium]